jgi:16S rRNA (guanine527-N7)-methyltransferase
MPPPPDAAGTLFGSVLPTAESYARLLAGPGVERGLVGPGEAARIWDRHLLNCAAVAELVPMRGEIADLGSGAGLPGIVLAMLRPHTRVTLVEPMARRAEFVAECCEALGLANVRIRRARAEDLAGECDADVVTARAVARLDRLAPLAVGLARRGGLILAIKGASATAEVATAGQVLRELGVTDIAVVVVGASVLSQPTTVVTFRTPIDRPPPAGRRAGRRRAGRRPEP